MLDIVIKPTEENIEDAAYLVDILTEYQIAELDELKYNIIIDYDGFF